MNELTVTKAVLLGALQGATEFLPVSSSGHLTIAQALLGIRMENGGLMALDVCLHVGTLLAVVAVFWRDLWDIALGIFCPGRKVQNCPSGCLSGLEARRLGMLIAVGTLPAVVFGLSFKSFFEQLFSNPLVAGVMLLVTGLILWSTRYVKEVFRGALMGLDHSTMKWWHALVVGLAQAVAILPGVSRSGSTIAGGLWLGLDQGFAARFAFLLAIPAIGGAAVLQYKDFANLTHDALVATLVGTLVSAIVGFACIKWMLNIVRRGRLNWFAYYCWALGLLSVVLFATSSNAISIGLGGL